MKLAVLALTKHGAMLAKRVNQQLYAQGHEIFLYLPETYLSLCPGAKSFEGSLAKTVGRLFGQYDGMIMIMALGIVFRILAPHINDKRVDPAVLVLDEKGHFVISALSGHLGGANALTQELASMLEAIPVVTTATDVHGLDAVDVLAREYNLVMEPFQRVRGINSALVNGEPVGLYWDYPLPVEPTGFHMLTKEMLDNRLADVWTVWLTGKSMKPPNERTLLLRPRNITIGVGCRKGVEAAVIMQSIQTTLTELGCSPLCIKTLATVDIKAEEPGLKEVARVLSVPLKIFTRQEIKIFYDVKGNGLTRSALVEEKIGVGGVCEPVALLALSLIHI